ARRAVIWARWRERRSPSTTTPPPSSGSSHGRSYDRWMFRWLTAGESHGPQLTVIVEGLPAGLELSADDLRADLRRRQGGHGRGGRQQIEKDAARIVA